MELHGKNIIGSELTGGGKSFRGFDPTARVNLEPAFHEATNEDVNAALDLAAGAFEEYRIMPADKIASFLDRIAEELMTAGDELLKRANSETALPEARLTGERGRMVNQFRMFAEVVREGSWVDARIDHALPDRKPLPRPDLRRMLIPVGPVVVFGASNFPFAFSVGGGDTASALAAGNPVVVKAHPAHPGTSEIIGRAIQVAAVATGIPDGVFSMLHGTGNEVGLALVRHSATKTVAFTGSLQGGRALYNAAAARPEPIAVFAEMGSTNPVFVLPGALAKNGDAIAQGLVQSVTLGVGQFCTNPGLVIGMKGGSLDAFMKKAAEHASQATPGTMLFPAICDRFGEGVSVLKAKSGAKIIGESASAAAGKAGAVVFAADGATFLAQPLLQEELFGPATLIVSCESREQLEEIARQMPGQLTATIQGTEEDLREHSKLVELLQQKVGRLLFNGFPTGVEVSPAMHHGGPYPATTDPRYTSVGTAAIARFARPICFQSFPDAMLPEELQNNNARHIWRLVDNQLTKEDC